MSALTVTIAMILSIMLCLLEAWCQHQAKAAARQHDHDTVRRYHAGSRVLLYATLTLVWVAVGWSYTPPTLP